jgi:TRAP-type C4-dicarboxylate transport system substrate-binding protein
VAKLVKERTQGRIEIQVFANSQLGGVAEMVDGVKSGAIAIGHHDFASLGTHPAGDGGVQHPFVYRDVEHAMRASDPRSSAALQALNKELVDKGGMRIVGSFFQGTRHLTSKEKVLTPKPT